MSDEPERRNLRMPNDDEMFALVTEMQGYGRVTLRCNDGRTRMGRIPGRMRKRIWIREEDVVLIEPWDWQDEKADISWRYDGRDADQLRREGHLDVD